MNPRLVVQLPHLLGKGSEGLTLSGGSFEQVDREPDEEGHEGPGQGKAGPPRVVREQLEEGEDVRPDIKGREDDIEDKKAEDSKHSGVKLNFSQYLYSLLPAVLPLFSC